MNRTRPFSLARKLVAVSFVFGMPAFVLGCPKKPVPVDIDSGPAPIPTPSVTETVLQPLDQGLDADVPDVVDAAKKPTGPTQTASQAHVKQCCTALHAQAKAMNNDPTLTSFAVTCDGLAPQVGPSSGGQAPELEPLRQILKGKPTIPAICQGL
ncbi:MAG TPA: hypothetical protein VF407_17065 [Polyangiaceae bacterium]